MTNAILLQLGHSTLLPSGMAKAILSGNNPPRTDLIYHLIVGAMDAHFAIESDPNSGWNERRASRQALTITFLAALLFDAVIEPEKTK